MVTPTPSRHASPGGAITDTLESVHTATDAASPRLPTPRGPLSQAVVNALGSGADPGAVDAVVMPAEADLAAADPWGADLHLALHTCYELHYRGFVGVDAEWEWCPTLLALRTRLEKSFRAAVVAGTAIPDEVGPADVEAEMDALSTEQIAGEGPSWFLRDEGTWDQMREMFAIRSIYHLKEADPHAWAIPRLSGQAKAAYVAVEFDEFGGGRGDRMHQNLFADLLAAADLETGYLAYLDRAPASALAPITLMSMFGLHRSSRGATVGHLAATEITSSPGSRRLADALARMDAPAACRGFYLEHVEADAVHEQVLRTDVVGDLIAREPGTARDVLFGMRAFGLVEDRLAAHMMDSWTAGEPAIDLT
ncbi:iron-containing redox enzyme family protein [Williamsia deligens]|uniref:Iron-containing redox enzyme family protein n=1 Tax=Williamsia deligens TaxID=321325 RepID=A0ABW3G9M7_9NOCA|nr:iron-containing redox enzyme family protein [Williamsia deligens]MCP2195939.1 Iron-containing redox enzyme [Williamsia deligens]